MKLYNVVDTLTISDFRGFVFVLDKGHVHYARMGGVVASGSAVILRGRDSVTFESASGQKFSIGNNFLPYEYENEISKQNTLSHSVNLSGRSQAHYLRFDETDAPTLIELTDNPIELIRPSPLLAQTSEDRFIKYQDDPLLFFNSPQENELVDPIRKTVVITTDIQGIHSGILVEDENVSDRGTLVSQGNLSAFQSNGNPVFFSPGEIQGHYGVFHINSIGQWNYTANNSSPVIQALRQDETQTEIFTVITEGGNATENINITLQGANDIARIGGIISRSIQEDQYVNVLVVSSTPNKPPPRVDGISHRPDIHEISTINTSSTLPITDADAGESSFIVREGVEGRYGIFNLDSVGNWSYSANNAQLAIQSLGAKQILKETFTVISQDGSAEQRVEITIQGSNDIASIGGITSGSIQEDEHVAVITMLLPPSPSEIDGTTSDSIQEIQREIISTSGTLTISDADAGESSFIAQNEVGSYWMFNLDSAGNWSYSASNMSSVIQSLGAGQALIETFVITSKDGTTQDVKITINGSNDIATIGGTTSGSIQEDQNLMVTVVPSGEIIQNVDSIKIDMMSTNGRLTIWDEDAGEASFIAQSVDGTYGSFSLKESGDWIYTADNNRDIIQKLAAGVIVHDTFTVTSHDGTTCDVVIDITGHNDAPHILWGNSFTNISEDKPENGGNLVSHLSAGSTDADANAAKGIAITYLSDSRGTWEYSTDAGTSWSKVDTIRLGSALLLRAQDKIRFVPDGMNAETSFIRYRAWDQTSGIAGETVRIGRPGGDTAFSREEVSSWISVSGINDAPVNSVPGDQTVNEDTKLIFSSENNNLISIGDVDAGDAPVKVTLGVGYGVLTLNGINSIHGLTFDEWSDGSADATMTFTGTISAINAALSGLTYQGALNFHGEDTLTITTNDLENTGLGGPLWDGDTVNIQVTAINDAPSIETHGHFTGITEDQTQNGGNLVSDLLTSADVDTDAAAGMAITGLSSSHGIWQYYLTNVSKTWVDVGTVSDGSALLLRAEDRIRFIPDGIDADNASITYRAWDQTSGTAGETANTGVNGGTTAFSTEEATSTIVVKAVNDAPVNTAPGEQTVNEDAQLVFSSGNNNLISIGDVDAGDAPVKVTLGVGYGVLTLNGVDGLTFDRGSDGSADATMTFTGTISNINAALSGLTY